MRPLKLKVQAFGPYPKIHEIDFRKALDARLFGIYGPTGSGKSTVFSAISFALFGVPAKPDQDTGSLRSHHANDDCLTEVEFTFEIGYKQYFIRRWPDQKRPTKKGDGETVETHKAWLFDVTGIEIDQISSENLGIPLAERKVTEVADKLYDILGYGAAQFQQIILLPQGRFEAFLTAKTSDRIDILRELFDVSLYRQLAARASEDAKKLRRDIEIKHGSNHSRLEKEGVSSLEALFDKKIKSKNNQEKLLNLRNKLHKKLKLSEKNFITAENLNQKFLEHEKCKKLIADLDIEKTEIENKKLLLKGIEVAKNLAEVENSVQQSKVDYDEAKEKFDILQKNLKKAVTDLNASKKKLDTETQKKPLLENKRNEKAELERFRTILTNTDDKLSAKIKADKEAEDALAAFNKLNDFCREASLECENLIKTISKTQENEARFEKLKSSLVQKNHLIQEIEKHQNAKKDLNAAINIKKNAKKENDDHKRELLAAEKALVVAEQDLSQMQAGQLAEKLKPGDPCMVCGSKHHPELANYEAFQDIEQIFKSAKSLLQVARGKEKKSSAELAVANSTVQEKEKILSTFEKPAVSLSILNEDRLTIEKELETLDLETETSQLKEELDKKQNALRKNKEALENLRTAKEDSLKKQAQVKQALETALETIPVDLQNKDVLNTRISETELAIIDIEAAIKAAEADYSSLKEEHLKIEERLEAAQNNQSNFQRKFEEEKDRLNNRIKDAGLTFEDYTHYKDKIPEFETIQNLITDFEFRNATANDNMNRLNNQVKGKARPNLDELKTKKDNLEIEYQNCTDEEATAKAFFNHLNATYDELSKSFEFLSKKEEEYAPLGALSKLFEGNNQAKTKLEIFAIAAMFDQVLNAANLRLKPMSAGRYTMERKIETTKGAGQRGLEIAIHDVHTGRSRDTSTLSGGESFMAALSLALGLSDIVQNIAGGIRLDTIFIDEGFGSLDSETLDQALQTLQDIIGENRVVGLISHVDTVQQAIPYGFQVKKTNNGSEILERTP